ncbi:MAG: hypothetical protein Q4B99_01065 [Clostridia bacterium]|nr:hypothetical protein [Clostridia bacterium]
MELLKLYEDVGRVIDSVDFDALWRGFKRCDFALYDDAQVVLNGELRPKTDEFLANTAILYEGRYIAIWHVAEELDIDVLASKLVHEMFHAYQYECGESRFPDEFAALRDYEYSPQYMCLKQAENERLAAAFEEGGARAFADFLALRKRRREEYPYQYAYESSVEAVEGSAQYVELQVLRARCTAQYERARRRALGSVADVQRLMPVRIQCYDVGALTIEACLRYGVELNLEVGATSEFLIPDEALDNAEGECGIEYNAVVAQLYEEKLGANRARIESIRRTGEKVAEGEFELLGVNVYSATHTDGYIYTEYFLMYGDVDGPVTLYGNYLVRLEHGKITEIYMER